MHVPSFLKKAPSLVYKSFASSGAVSNDKVWYYWNREYDTTSSSYLYASTNSVTSVDSNDYIWKVWNSDRTGTSDFDYVDPFFFSSTSTGNSTNIQVWEEWNIPQEAREASRRASAEQREAWRRMEEEQRRLAEQQRAENEARWKREAEEKEKAKKRAEELLLSFLTPEQRDELERLNHFHLIVGERKYRIKRGRSRNIELLDASGKPVEKLCAHPRDYIPDADTMLAQKLMLETDEEAFLKMANHTPIHYPPEPPTIRASTEQVARAV